MASFQCTDSLFGLLLKGESPERELLVNIPENEDGSYVGCILAELPNICQEDSELALAKFTVKITVNVLERS